MWTKLTTFLNQAHVRFPEVAFIQEAVMRVCPPRDIIANQTSPIAFQFLCMALAIDIIDGQGLSNKVHHE